MTHPKRLRVLWLCSWYPSSVDLFSGDFIQRHAEAVSEYADIHVLHAIGSPSHHAYSIAKDDRTQALREWIAYYPTQRWDQRWLSALGWLRAMGRMVRAYQFAYGLPDLVHVQIPYKSGLIARYLLARFGVPHVVTEHWGIYQVKTADRFENRSFLFRLITRLGYKKSVCSISVSDYQSRQLQTYLGALCSRTIYNVVDTRFFYFVERAVRPFTFLHVSDWSENKNPEGILRVFDRLHRAFPQTRLILVGGKGDRGEWIRQLAKDRSAAIYCEGEVTYGTVAGFMKEADCFVLNSSMENSPCVIGEALCAGLSVIATDVGGVSELIDPVCSRLIPVGDEPALYLAMQEVMQNSEGLNRREIAERAKTRFSYQTIGRQLDEAYREALGMRSLN
ncbi:MAG: glycosyltransferase family 4 protein [Bacteroidetes bacterium]|nr:glycosyltransferase family 4 protein [Bacteroidota bacterium]